MRFSAAFNRPLPAAPRPADAVPRAETARAAQVAATPGRKAAAPPLRELPADLDQRVRLVGEW